MLHITYLLLILLLLFRAVLFTFFLPIFNKADKIKKLAIFFAFARIFSNGKKQFPVIAKSAPDARDTLGEQHIRLYDDMAISTGFIIRSQQCAMGKTMTNPDFDTFVYRYREGKWLIVDHHSSLIP